MDGLATVPWALAGSTHAALLGLLMLSVALLATLVAFVLARKALRDRREAASRRRRAGLRDVLQSDHPEVLACALRSLRTARDELDLIGVLQTRAPASAALSAATTSSGLAARLEHHLDARHAATRGRAVLLLGLLRPEGAGPSLRTMVADRDPDVRLAACAALALSRDPASVRLLLDALSECRLDPARVIERIGAPWAVEPLLDELQTSAPGPERVAITRALGLAGDRRAETALVALLDADDDEARISAVRSLATVGGEAARPSLERALRDPSWEVRAQAAKTIGRIGDAQSVLALEALLTDSAWWVRANAARAMAELGTCGIAALERATQHPDPFARDRAREALTLTQPMPHLTTS